MTPVQLYLGNPEAIGTAIEALRHNFQHPKDPIALTQLESASLLAVIAAALEMAKASHTQDQERKFAAWDAIDAALGL